MWIAEDWKDYELLDCGGGEKLERWDKQFLVRPDPQAIWETPRKNPAWKRANARYLRSQTGGGHWEKKALPESWKVHYKDLTFQVKPMNFKHTGLFPEQAVNWDFAMEKIRSAGRPIRVLNLFAYTGGATVACAKAGASVCHVDAAKGMVAWAKENAKLSGLEDAPIRWIVDDCAKFVEREIRRGKTYDAIIMDPPSYGRGPAERFGNWRTTCTASSSSVPMSSRTSPFSCSSTPIPQVWHPRFWGICCTCWWRRSTAEDVPGTSWDSLSRRPAWPCPAAPPAAG